jgi:septin family protein
MGFALRQIEKALELTTDPTRATEFLLRNMEIYPSIDSSFWDVASVPDAPSEASTEAPPAADVAAEPKPEDKCVRKDQAPVADKNLANMNRVHRADTNLGAVLRDNHSKNSLNLMVAGMESLGKTTATMGLFGPFIHDVALLAAANNWAQRSTECRDLEKQVAEIKESIRDKDRQRKEAETLSDISAARALTDEITKMERERQELLDKLQTATEVGQKKAREFEAIGQKINGLKMQRTKVLSVHPRQQSHYDEYESLDQQIKELEQQEETLRQELQSDVSMHATPANDSGLSGQVLEEKTTDIRECFRFPVVDKTKILDVTVTDTPGYGDDVRVEDAVDRVCKEVERRFHKHKESQDIGGTQFTKRQEVDEMFHCCLYFIKPHRFSKIDELFIQKLSPFVPIIPILAKADTMTLSERKEFRKVVRTRLAEMQLQHPPYEFDPEHINRYVRPDEQPFEEQMTQLQCVLPPHYDCYNSC